MKATIEDIAQQLEISKSTVSRSLRQDPAIHPRTRARVVEVAMKMGYEGRTQRGSRTPVNERSLGVLMVSGSSPKWSFNENEVRMLQGISEECDRVGISLRLHTIAYSNRGNMESDPELVPGSLRDHSAEAMLLIGPHLNNDVNFIAAQVPTVTLSWLYKGVDTDVVLLDNVEGIARQVEKMVDAGHRRLAWVSQQVKAPFFTARYSGFVQGCMTNGLELSEQSMVQPAPEPEPKPFKDTDLQALIDNGITGFVCANDTIAWHLISELAEQGIKVPEDVSVTGFDALSTIDPKIPVLDSVNAHFEDVGREAVRLVVRRLENPTARPVMLTVRSSMTDGLTIKKLDNQ